MRVLDEIREDWRSGDREGALLGMMVVTLLAACAMAGACIVIIVLLAAGRWSVVPVVAAWALVAFWRAVLRR